MAAYSHLPLRRVEGELFKRKSAGFPPGTTRQASIHGQLIKSELTASQQEFSKLPTIEGIDPALILKIKLAGALSEDDWRKLGLSILSIDGDRTTVLFADDKSLASFHQKLDAYKGKIPEGQSGAPYAQLIGAIDEVSLISAADRIGRVLKGMGYDSPQSFDPDVEYTLDIELHRPADRAEADLFVYRLEVVIRKAGGSILSSYSGNNILLVRLTCGGQGIADALELPEVAVVDIPPEPDLELAEIGDINLTDVAAGSSPASDALVIGIIDSGVNFGHKLLSSTEAGAFSASASFGPDDEGGHGTSVASIAAFGDIRARLEAKNFDAQFKIASARVTTSAGKFPSDVSVPALMETSIRTLHDDYGCRIINISLGEKDRVYGGERVDPWTATLDALARELDVLIIVSAGNRGDLTAAYNDKIIKSYPRFLLEPASRLISPAIGANIVSVGSIAHSNGLEDEDKDIVGIQPICSKEEPSPFTRCGPGVRNMVKPDFVDFGGTAVWDGPTQALVSGNFKPAAGVLAFHNKPLERAFRSRSGTSFAAPNLAYKAALLLSEIPDASANLLRALLATSARTPQAVRSRPEPMTEKELLIPCGYGVADPAEAATSDDNRVVLYVQDTLKLDHFGVYEVPIPVEFQKEKGAKEIRVALAFDPPTRHTRAEYLGVTMGWRLLRGTSPEDVFDRFRKWEPDEGELPDFPGVNVCPTDINSTLRERGTLQVGTYCGKVDISNHGGPYFVAVWCSRRWAPKDIEQQSFALSVQLRHQNVSTLYQRLQAAVKTKVMA